MGAAEVYRHKTWQGVVTTWRGIKPGECLAPRCLAPSGRAIVHGHRLWGLDIGHIVSVLEATRMGWTIEQMNTLSNTRPEHRRCNRSAGARKRNAVRRREPQTKTSGAW